MLHLATRQPIVRDHFTLLPISDQLISYMNKLAAADGYSRGDDPSLCPQDLPPRPLPTMPVDIANRPRLVPPGQLLAAAHDAGVDVTDSGTVTPSILPNTRISRRNAILDHLVDADSLLTPPETLQETSDQPPPAAIELNQPVPIQSSDPMPVPETHIEEADDRAPPSDELRPLRRSARLTTSPETNDQRSLPTEPRPLQAVEPRLLRRSARSNAGVPGERFAFLADDPLIMDRLRHHLVQQRHWHDSEFAFKISVTRALRERKAEALPVILKELRQMLDKMVWHPVHMAGLSHAEKKAIIRSSMFLRDKYHSSGAFDKFKARLVAGGNLQDKGLYEDLSSPTAATTSVLTIAAIAAHEERIVEVVDIGGAFLHADIKLTGIPVHMRIDRQIADLLIQLMPFYSSFQLGDGSIIVRLDKALYGCVEASSLWFANLCGALSDYGFTPNPYDPCVFNKWGNGNQLTVVLHVDDLMVTCASQATLDDFSGFLKQRYGKSEINIKTGRVIGYVGMTFDFSIVGEVSVTMENTVEDTLAGYGVLQPRATPATESLFETRDAPKIGTAAAKLFHTKVAQLLYLAKRTRPECLTAVSFLSTRVQAPDIDDEAKLRRLLGYVLHTKERGITLRIGEFMSVRAYIDAAYGVHSASGKSHTGCAIVLGGAGPVFAKSGKQKIVTKSSTEAELVGMSDTASQAIHLRNFVVAQGYELGPVVIYQDNLSCMALMRRGGPGSERSRHINIRHFWLAERVKNGEVAIEHLGTEKMMANVLTKPVQGAQFEKERSGLTNWKCGDVRPRGVLVIVDLDYH